MFTYKVAFISPYISFSLILSCFFFLFLEILEAATHGCLWRVREGKRVFASVFLFIIKCIISLDEFIVPTSHATPFSRQHRSLQRGKGIPSPDHLPTA